jgi:RNA polymerase sigma factor (TIGR02999 family)
MIYRRQGGVKITLFGRLCEGVGDVGALGEACSLIRLAGILGGMTDVTPILSQIEEGDPSAADELLPLVYQELRALAAAKLASEKPGQTLQATALVHEAYLRLVDVRRARHWNSRGHFFAAAAEAMRRVLIECARHKPSQKGNGDLTRIELAEGMLPGDVATNRFLALDEVIDKLHREEPRAAEIVNLRLFAGCSIDEAAGVLGMSRSQGYRQWTYARAWLLAELDE